jgi:hypothetical protein
MASIICVPICSCISSSLPQLMVHAGAARPTWSARVKRLKLKTEAQIESSLRYFSFKLLTPGAFNGDSIG